MRSTDKSFDADRPDSLKRDVYKKEGDKKKIKVIVANDKVIRVGDNSGEMVDGKPVKIIHEFAPVFNTECFLPSDCHARGVFFYRPRKIFVNYESRTYEYQQSQWFGNPVNTFAKNYKSCKQLLIFGNQRDTDDCEKRVIRFGICCWNKFKLEYDEGIRFVCGCGLQITHIEECILRS
jgi:hypothetical protein